VRRLGARAVQKLSAPAVRSLGLCSCCEKAECSCCEKAWNVWSSFGLNDEIVVIINDDKCIFISLCC